MKRQILQFQKKHDGCWVAMHNGHLYRTVRSQTGEWIALVFPPATFAGRQIAAHPRYCKRVPKLADAKQRLQALAASGEFA